MNKACIVDYECEEFQECSEKCMSLLQKMLVKHPEQRLTAEQCLNHEFFKQGKKGGRILKNSKNMMRYN